MIPDIKNRKNINLIAFDPGEITGVAYFEKGEFQSALTYKQEDLIELINADWSYNKQTIVVIESFRLYEHKAGSLSNNQMITPQIIGKLKEWFKDYKIIEQSASLAKGFWTNDKLKEADCYVKNRHCRDAIRHGLYYLYFGKEK